MDLHWVEKDLTPALQKLHSGLGGTADFIRYRPAKKHLRVRDFKYGAGVLVDVEENEQAMIYALGALLTIGKPCDTVTATIDQPRAEHPDGRSRDYTFDATRLLEFAAELVEAAKRTDMATAAYGQDMKPWAAEFLRPGKKQCQWCPAKPHCPALQEKQAAMMANDFAEVNLPALSPAKIAEALIFIPAVKARIKAIEELAYTRATQGGEIPGFKLVEKRPTRQWRDEFEVVNWAKANAVDPYAPPTVLSPAQLEKRLAETAPKGAKKKAGEPLVPFIEKVSSGTALVPVDDDRPAAKALLESKDFAAAGAAEAQQQSPVNLFN